LAISAKIPPSLKKRAAKIKVVLMDVDGTITDGSVSLLSQPDGSALEMKTRLAVPPAFASASSPDAKAPPFAAA